MEQQGKIHGNKPRVIEPKLDLNLENLTGNIITFEIAKREFMYGWDICKNPEGYTWNKSTTIGRHFKKHSLLFTYNTF